MLDAMRIGSGKVFDANGDTSLEEIRVDIDGSLIVVHSDGGKGFNRGTS